MRVGSIQFILRTRILITASFRHSKNIRLINCYFTGGGFGGRKESGQLRFGGKDKPFAKPIQLMSEGEIKVQLSRKKSHLPGYMDR